MLSSTKTLGSPAEESAAERRTAIRYQITVSAEVIELKSGTRFSTRTTDLGPGGCFVDTLMPLPVGAKVSARLSRDNMRFEIAGAVTFSQAGLGMGISFDDMAPERQHAFDAWLAELTCVRPHEFPVDAPENTPKAPAGTPQQRLDRLIRLLVKRGVMSKADADSLGGEPLI